jgi:isopentenyl diphosphate isomerase/L-lactate dehydrogenase-like FMN-dependent dehydrogenase
LLQAALDGPAAVDEWVLQFALERRTAAFLSGVTRTRDLSTRRPVVTGETREWIDQLGYGPRSRSAK